MPSIKDLTGKKYNMLTVISQANKKLNNRIAWNCLCDCGNEKIITGNDLCTNNTKSCGTKI